MIKFWYHTYELEPLSNIGAVAERVNRQGALIKVQWPGNKIGYADLFPWPELGDFDLQTQLVALAKGRISGLVEQTIWLAKKDAEARSVGKNLFSGAAKVKNHFLISDISKLNDNVLGNLRSAGFTTVKIKVGKALEAEAKAISRLIQQNPLMVRLDFNAKVSYETYKQFMNFIDLSARAKIEFVEDPCPWNPEHWKEAATLAPLAMDEEYSKVNWETVGPKPPFKVLIIKPARRDVEKDIKIATQLDLKVAVTSAMDHPLGVAHAYNVASDLKKLYPSMVLDCGCLSLRAYRPTEFFLRVLTTGPYLSGVNGTGIGFDDLLQKTEWKPIAEILTPKKK